MRATRDLWFFVLRVTFFGILLSLPRTNVALSAGGSSSSSRKARPPPQVLRDLLDTASSASSSPILLPCCYDGLTARLVARAGFSATFLTGFGVSAARGFPDTQLVSFDEMQASCRAVAEGLASAALEAQQVLPSVANEAGNSTTASGGGSSRKASAAIRTATTTSTTTTTLPAVEPIPCIADGDTGYGNAVNVHRTVWGYGRAGMAGVMVEDQVAPKRCGHVAGKAVIPMAEAVQRIRAAANARDEYEAMYGPGTGPLVLARTDALRTDGLSAAIERCQAFIEVGADMTFLEAPTSIEDMQAYCDQVPGPKLANMLEQGSTPILPPTQLKEIGYTMAAYPLTLLSASIRAMQDSLAAIREGRPTDDLILSFADTKDAVGFTRYGQLEQRYRTD
jgi:2-methylisocitrate lyase-like PEP mutase family enzyme